MLRQLGRWEVPERTAKTKELQQLYEGRWQDVLRQLDRWEVTGKRKQE